MPVIRRMPSTVTPFSSPAITVTSASQVISAGHQVMSAIPEALQAFSASPLTTVDAPLAAVTSPLSKLSSLTTPSDVALTHLSSMNKAAALQTATSLLSQLTKPSVTARFGRGASIGTSSWEHCRCRRPGQSGASRTADLQPSWVCEPIHLVHASEPPS